jgi:hypothetical protein
MIALLVEARSFLVGALTSFADLSWGVGWIVFRPTGSTSREKEVCEMVKKAIKRRDATGHLDAEYERKLRASSQGPRDDGQAFLTGFHTGEPLAEEMAEAFLQSATSGEESEAERRDRILPEESGGPFVRTRASQEFAYDFDESNIAEATREPLPKTSLADP